MLTSSFFLFCEIKNMLKEIKKAVSPDFCTCSPAYIYTCVLRTPHGIYVYGHYSTSRFFRALQVSRPDTRAHVRKSHMQYVCVFIHTHTQHIHITPLKKMGSHFHCPNESLTLEINANHRPAGKIPLTPLLHTMQWCLKHL